MPTPINNAVNDYWTRVRSRAIPFDLAVKDLAEALETPLFVGVEEGESMLNGYIDSHDKRFLALIDPTTDKILGIGPPHWWKSAKEAWKAVGWNVSKNRLYTGIATPPKQSPAPGKRCSRCGEVKPYNQFPPRNDRPDGEGVKSFCRECERQRNRDYYAANKDRIKVAKAERSKKWYLENRAKRRKT